MHMLPSVASGCILNAVSTFHLAYAEIWTNGKLSAFQAEDEGSIPSQHSVTPRMQSLRQPAEMHISSGGKTPKGENGKHKEMSQLLNHKCTNFKDTNLKQTPSHTLVSPIVGPQIGSSPPTFADLL